MQLQYNNRSVVNPNITRRPRPLISTHARIYCSRAWRKYVVPATPPNTVVIIAVYRLVLGMLMAPIPSNARALSKQQLMCIASGLHICRPSPRWSRRDNVHYRHPTTSHHDHLVRYSIETPTNRMVSVTVQEEVTVRSAIANPRRRLTNAMQDNVAL